MARPDLDTLMAMMESLEAELRGIIGQLAVMREQLTRVLEQEKELTKLKVQVAEHGRSIERIFSARDQLYQKIDHLETLLMDDREDKRRVLSKIMRYQAVGLTAIATGGFMLFAHYVGFWRAVEAFFK